MHTVLSSLVFDGSQLIHGISNGSACISFSGLTSFAVENDRTGSVANID
jgi:hypothetical protein